MAHKTQRRKTVRVRADLKLNDVRIQDQRRYFRAQNANRATRDARAIAAAFDIGTEFISDRIDRSNLAGQERAVKQAGAGGLRDVNDENAAYNRVWDRLDDEKNLNLAKQELPEILRGMDAENQPEEVVQAAISQYMEGQFAGIDTEGGDHAFLAAGLLALETTLIADHRDGVISKIKEEQIIDTFEAAKVAYAETGEVPYDDIAERTNTFLDSEEKMSVYWEMIYDIAIEAGDPDIIKNTPKNFPGGDPTGINDPRRADAHRAAISAATTKQANMAKVRQDAEDDDNDNLRFNTQMQIYLTRERGEDVSALIARLSSIPGTKLSDISAAKNFGDSQLDERDSRSPDLPYVVALWNQIYNGTAGPEMVLFASAEGLLGSGKQAKEETKKMMSTISSVQKAGESNDRQEITQWRGVLNKRYNAQLGGLLQSVNPVMNRINIDANAMYLDLTQNGTSGADAIEKVFEKFDAMVNNLPSIDEEELKGRRGQDQFTGKTSVSISVIKSVLEGQLSVNEAFAGIPTFIIEDRLIDELDAGNITTADAAFIAQQL